MAGNVVVVARQHSDGTWVVSVRGYVDGVYRIETTDSVYRTEDLGRAVRNLLAFFASKHLRSDGSHR